MKQDRERIKKRLSELLGLDAEISKIIIAGMGVTGMSVARYLKALGFDFVMADNRNNAAIANTIKQELADIKIHTGPFDPDFFSSATHLIVSPGISLKEPAISRAMANGVEVIGDIDLFVCSTEKPIIAITGSNGKSTVTTMLGDMAKAAGVNAVIGGNLGEPALDLLKQNASFYVLEISSFQLERTRILNAIAATVLNVSADHLDRHESLEDYAQQKRRIFMGSGTMVINKDDPIVSAMQEKERKTFTFSIQQHADFYLSQVEQAEYLMHGIKPLMALAELPLEGRHNAANALAALALGVACGFNEQAMCSALKAYKGLPHRMQRVAEINGVTWVNDSKATNIGACIAALQGYNHKVILIAGGDAKGADMMELVPTVKAKTKSVVLMGKDAGLIEQALDGCVPIYKATDIRQAVIIAAGIADAGESVLLSPACASQDQYKNYQERGDKFMKAVLELAA